MKHLHMPDMGDNHILQITYHFSVYEHTLVLKESELIKRKFIVLKDNTGDICAFTDFHRYIRSARRQYARRVTDDGNSRHYYVVKLLNYVFFDKYHIRKLNDLTVEMVSAFLNDYGKALLPNDSSERTKSTVIVCIRTIIDFLDEYIEKNKGKCRIRQSDLYNFDNIQKRRPLASFDSYFLFNDIINDYWASNLDLDTRLFYYPLFLWWQITAVIPLRPREFILTPRNCLEEKPDGTYITLRRNKLKGGNGKVSYLIDDDYIKVQYKIPDKLACIIKEYIQLTSSFAPTELETLFISDTHYKHWGQSKHKNSRYFTYINMHCVLRYFFYEIIQGKYHLKVIHDRNTAHLNEGEINFLYLGDTRHLALINIIAEGGTPVLAMMLAGHENIEMSAHYYTNITHLIECRTYKQYRKVLKGNVSYNISPAITLPDTIKNGKILEDGGMCYSDSYAKGNVSDCIKAVGKNGEIGYCLDCSFYFQKGSERFWDDDGKYKRKIEDDCNFLKEMIRQVRLGITDKEDIIQALNRLHSSSVTYQQYYEQKAKFIDEKGNKIWAERRS